MDADVRYVRLKADATYIWKVLQEYRRQSMTHRTEIDICFSPPPCRLSERPPRPKL